MPRSHDEMKLLSLDAENQPPVAVDDIASMSDSATSTTNVLANDSDPDGDVLFVANAMVTSGSGTVTINDDGSLTVAYTGGTMVWDSSANVTIAYTLSDGSLSADAILSVTVWGTFYPEPDPNIGNSKDNVIFGKSFGEEIFGKGGDDRLYGNGGADTLHGDGGRDQLWGGNGEDILIGGKGADRLRGDAGADSFVYMDIAESTVDPRGRDTLLDFVAGTDTIDLRAIHADPSQEGQPFHFIKDQAFHGRAGELRFDVLTRNTFIYGDVDGDGSADFAIRLPGQVQLDQHDFVL